MGKDAMPPRHATACSVEEDNVETSRLKSRKSTLNA
jgi:hypothetical protein